MATLARILLEFKRLPKCGKMVLFLCDLGRIGENIGLKVPRYHLIVHVTSSSQLGSGDRGRLLDSGNPSLINRLMEERFAKGASLWLYKVQDHVAGFGWTLVGHTMEPHFFPLNPEDVHFFDFFVFSEHRGKGINPVMVNSILKRMACVNKGRAYIECAEWNQPQLASLRRTPFISFAVATKHTRFGRTTVSWMEGNK